MAFLEHPKTFLTGLFQTAIAAADPMRVLAPHLPPAPKGRRIVIGAGKASARMAEAVEEAIGPCEGVVVTRYGYARPTKGIKIIEAAHPVPDAAGVHATQEILSCVKNLGPEDQVLCLISGGGSALLCAPIAGLDLEDKKRLNAVLLASGLPISQMNVIRKAVSAVKGGKLLQAAAPAQVMNLLISDVPGDDPAIIASGPTVPDRSNPQEALGLIRHHALDVPPHVIKAIETAAHETPATFDTPTQRSVIIAAPSQSLDAAAQAAKGCAVEILGDAIEGEARDLAASHAALARTHQAQMTPGDPPLLLLSGGECTVTRRGDGVGGPNAEYVLALGLALEGTSGIHVLAGDTDGVDGAAEIAGAFATSHMSTKAAKRDLDPRAALHRNDAHGFFAAMGDQIITGPTLTNVNDFRAILIQPPQRQEGGVS